MKNWNNHHLDLTAYPDVQDMLNDIENISPVLAEMQIADHPMFPQFDRYIRVYDITANSANEYIHFGYKQVLKDQETGKEFNIGLPTPEWVVYKDTWSYLRNEQNQPISLPYADGVTEGDNGVKVPSYKYMIWLMRNNKVGLLQLIQGYLQSFVLAKQSELDTL